MTRRKRAWNWAVAVAIAILGGPSLAAAQSSLQGGGLSTKAILALEECFDAFQNFTCGAAAGTITGAGTDGRNTRFSGATTIADGSFLDDGTNATLEDDVEFIIGETASSGLGGSPAVGGILWNTFAGSGVERLEIDATANAGLLVTVGAGGQLGGFIVTDPSFIHTFTQNPPPTTGNSLPSWIFFVDNPSAMDSVSDSRHGIILEMESNAADVAFSNQRGFTIDDTAATVADQEALRIQSGWDEEIFLTASDGVFHFTNDLSFEAFRGTPALKLNEFPRLVADYADLRMVSVGDGDTMAVMNGADTYSWLEINFTNGGHGTGGNFVYGVNVTPSGITGSAFATEIAFNVGTGWDAFLTVDEGVDTATFTVPTLTADHTYTFPNATGTVALTTDIGGTTNRVSKFTSATAQGDSNLLNEDTPGEGVSGDSLTLFGVMEIMDGADTVNMFLVDVTNANHTGAGNILNGIEFDAITGDAEAAENAISVQDGWDTFLTVDEGVDTATFTVPTLTADRTYTFPDQSGTVAMAADVTSFPLSSNTQVTNSGVEMQFGGTSAAISGTTTTLTLEEQGSTYKINEIAAGAGGDYQQLFGLQTAMNGTDSTNGLRLQFSGANHTGASNQFNAIEISGLSADVDARETALNIGSGWDYATIIATATITPPAQNPAGDSVGFFIDEDTDRVATATNDCALVARLSDGTEINVAILVTDGGCP